jgi:pimeloyl-ACP methyl ester carboxylesterase
MEHISNTHTIKNRNSLSIEVDVYPVLNGRVVFIVHGLSAFKDQKQLVVARDTFIKLGYTVVMFDTTNSFGKSEGKYEDATLTQYYEDLVDVINWSKPQEWFKKGISLCGFSFGGYSVIKYAEDYPEEVEMVIPIGPIISGKLSLETWQKLKPDELNEWKTSGWNETKSNSKPGLVKRLPWSHMEDRLKHDLHDHIFRLYKPIFFIASGVDTSVPLDVVRDFYNEVPAKIKDLQVIPGAPHTLKDDHHLAQMAKLIRKYHDRIVSHRKVYKHLKEM